MLPGSSNAPRRKHTFKDHVTFVQQRAETASNTWGENLQSLRSGQNIKQGDKPRRDSNRPTFQRATFATEINAAESTGDARPQPKDTSHKRKCTFCSGKHFIAECTTLKAKQVDERCAFLKDNNLCFNCLIPYHSASKCHQDSKCNKCEYKHHWLCHRENFQSERRANDNDATEDQVNALMKDEADECDVSVNAAQSTKPRVCLPIVPVRFTVGSKIVIVHALLDTGSTTTLCKQSLIEELGVTGTDITYHLTTMKGKCEETHGVEVNLQVSAVDGGEALELRDVWSTPDLPISLRNLPTQQMVR